MYVSGGARSSASIWTPRSLQGCAAGISKGAGKIATERPFAIMSALRRLAGGSTFLPIHAQQSSPGLRKTAPTRAHESLDLQCGQQGLSAVATWVVHGAGQQTLAVHSIAQTPPLIALPRSSTARMRRVTPPLAMSTVTVFHGQRFLRERECKGVKMGAYPSTYHLPQRPPNRRNSALCESVLESARRVFSQ